MSNKEYSEIINQKKQFIFDVEQTSNHVFPREKYSYYVYIKNISGVTIENFYIKIDNDDDIQFEELNLPDSTPISINNNETKLYELKASCLTTGVHTVHFLGYGEGTQILYKTLKIKCTRTYNSDKLIHRISIYDFSPYEENFSMEADNYSDEVTQTFKRQKLPYKAGEQPFPMIVNADNNTESQSFLDQYNEAKNTKEHVYQYISRENFEEDSVESYTGENLLEIINKINQESKYFKATFFGAGTNQLLNDFTQYQPNGFIHRMGLLTSELYHALGVIPTYKYMSDYLFRWAPHPSGNHLFMAEDGSGRLEDSNGQLLNLYPPQKAMRWGEHKWAGKGWFIYKVPTEEYKKTDEYKRLQEDRKIIPKETIGFFEELRDAEEFVKRIREEDDKIRGYRQEDFYQYEYIIEQSLYDTGIFFINIPIDKIPTNFYLMDSEDLYAIINRAKPFGMKPIINYVIERQFDLDIEQSIEYNRKRQHNFIANLPEIDGYTIDEYAPVLGEECGGNFVYRENKVTQKSIYQPLFTLKPEMTFNMDKVGFYSKMDEWKDIGILSQGYSTVKDYSISSLRDISKILYYNNFNEISFYMNKSTYIDIGSTSNNLEVTKEEISFKILDKDATGIRVPINARGKFNKGDYRLELNIKDNKGGYYQFNVQRDALSEMDLFETAYINSKSKKTIKKMGEQNIESLIVKLLEINTKVLLVFFIENDNKIYYFDHAIATDIIEISTSGSNPELFKQLQYNNSSLDNEIIINTPFYYTYENNSPIITTDELDWEKFYRLNTDKKSYTLIENKTNTYREVKDLFFNYNDINIPETAIIKEIRFSLYGKSHDLTKIYCDYLLNTNHTKDDSSDKIIQLRPQNIEAYPKQRESTRYYQIKYDQALQKGQTEYTKTLQNLITENELFLSDKEISLNDYIDSPNDYITVSEPFWIEVFDFTDISYPLNQTKGLYFVLEGYNDGIETTLVTQTVSETDLSSVVEYNIPRGYFYEKIPLLYPNSFLAQKLGVKFKFKQLTHDVKIFNTSLEVEFKNYQNISQEYNFAEEGTLYNNVFTTKILENYIYPADVNNGLVVKISFDDLKPGDYYLLNSSLLEIIYKDTDTNLMINKEKYQYVTYDKSYTTISGEANNAYLSGEFYNDLAKLNQIESNIGPDNNGIKLRDALYQSFEAQDDNITSIQILPNGFIGNPDETLRIGLYSNHENTPYKLIKQVYSNGWTKNNDELKGVSYIKYNLNVDNLKIGETYWIKIEVLNPQENSYYLLKSINETKPRHKLLLRENNNYINTLSTLTFNIYSRNLSKTFKSIPTTQQLFNNPYILIGLHKSQGEIRDLTVKKYIETVVEEDNTKPIIDEDNMDNSLINETPTKIASIKITAYNGNHTVNTKILDTEEEE